MITGKKILNPKCTLRSHLDGVRSLFFTAVDPILVTASEVIRLKKLHLELNLIDRIVQLNFGIQDNLVITMRINFFCLTTQ